MGKSVVAIIFIFIAVSLEVVAVSKVGSIPSTDKLDWKTIKKDVHGLSRNGFYHKYLNALKDSGLEVNKRGHLLSSKEVQSNLNKVSKLFFLRGYSQSEEINAIKKEFNALNESSSGAYAVLKKRVYDLNQKYYRDRSIAPDLRRQVNDELSDIFRLLEKHHLAISSLPSMAQMVSILGDKVSASNIQSQSAVESSANKMQFSVKQVEYTLLGFVGVLILMVAGIKYSQKVAKRKLALARSKMVPGMGLNSTGVIGISARGRVKSINPRARDILQGNVKEGDDWDRFFKENFFNGKKYLGVKGFHRFVHSPKNIYFLNGKIDKVSQKRIIEISIMTLRDFDQALSLMERSSIRVDSMEIIDNVFTELVNLKAISLSLDIFTKFHFGRGSDYLYLSSLEGKKYLGRVLKIIDCVKCLKTTGDISRIDIERQGSDFNIKATFSHCCITEIDLKEIVSFDGERIALGEVFNSFQAIPNSYETSLIVKNLTLNGERKVEFKFKIQDNSHFETIHREKELGQRSHV